ncbi:MAG TPA: hypothetical protein VK698_02405, partial [Kofleriaceae bacterium]|nr:hypothetical protein [Kofleriaceae bacterium]
TAAATTAAILGVLFSTSSNVLLGVGVPLDAVGTDSDPGPSDRRSKRASKKTDDGEEEADDPDPPEPVDATKLVPWVQLPTNTPP